MTYNKFFSDDVPSFMRSPVREIFRKVDLASIYSFAGGYPDASTFPLDRMQDLAARVVEKYGAKALQYGGTQGVPELREVISRRYGVPVERVQITTSSQQGIDVCARVFLNPGDTVLTTNPAYLGALQSFRAYRARVEDLAAAREHPCNSAKFIYIVPDFCNPTGTTMTLEERKGLVEFARKEDLLIVEDSPYRELRYSGEPLPTIYSLAPERTLHLGSFSKIFAPGFRLGWIIGPPELLEQIFVCKQALDLCPPVFDQYLAAEFMGSGELDRNLEKSIALYRDKRDYMLELLEKYMPEGISWTRPEGGLFLWLTLPPQTDTVAMYDSALSAGVAYVAGTFFSLDGGFRNAMRLNFSYLARERMEDGVKLLAAELKKPQFRKMSGAGNRFVVLDARGSDTRKFRSPEYVRGLCARYATDGFMLLDAGEGISAEGYDFSMDFFNPDGSGGMMCGNGGRCIAAFADLLGIKPSQPGRYRFLAPDGPHGADILERPSSAGGKWTVRLEMQDVNGIQELPMGWFLNTGTRHLVKFVEDVDAVDVPKEGKSLRRDRAFAPEGTNVNFVQVCEGFLKIRTFEKGVEAETLACGTGITAGALTAFAAGKLPDGAPGRKRITLQARSGDLLEVSFTPESNGAFRDITLTGPAEFFDGPDGDNPNI